MCLTRHVTTSKPPPASVESHAVGKSIAARRSPTSANLVMGFYTFTPAIVNTCHLAQPSTRREYEISEAIHLHIQSGRTVDAIRIDGWRLVSGDSEDRDKAADRLTGELEAYVRWDAFEATGCVASC